MSALALPGFIGDPPASMIPRRRRMAEEDDLEPDEIDYYTFPVDVKRVLLDVPGARLARALENAPRNTQKWTNGSEPAPDHAIAFVNGQLNILADMDPQPVEALRQQCQSLVAAGLHPEVVASMLSVIYEELVGKAIR
jgi:hypothetical protein